MASDTSGTIGAQPERFKWGKMCTPKRYVVLVSSDLVA